MQKLPFNTLVLTCLCIATQSTIYAAQQSAVNPIVASPAVAFDKEAALVRRNSLPKEANILFDEQLIQTICKPHSDHRLPTVQHFLKIGASANARNAQGEPVLHMALKISKESKEAFDARRQIIAALAQAGANLNTQYTDYSTHSLTALMRAALSNQHDILKPLVDAGSNVDEQNNLGHTALMYAAWHNCQEATNILAAMANVRLRNKANKTALDLAREQMNDAAADRDTNRFNKSSNIVEILEQYVTQQ